MPFPYLKYLFSLLVLSWLQLKLHWYDSDEGIHGWHGSLVVVPIPGWAPCDEPREHWIIVVIQLLWELVSVDMDQLQGSCWSGDFDITNYESQPDTQPTSPTAIIRMPQKTQWWKSYSLFTCFIVSWDSCWGKGTLSDDDETLPSSSGILGKYICDGDLSSPSTYHN